MEARRELRTLRDAFGVWNLSLGAKDIEREPFACQGHYSPRISNKPAEDHDTLNRQGNQQRYRQHRIVISMTTIPRNEIRINH